MKSDYEEKRTNPAVQAFRTAELGVSWASGATAIWPKMEPGQGGSVGKHTYHIQSLGPIQ